MKNISKILGLLVFAMSSTYAATAGTQSAAAPMPASTQTQTNNIQTSTPVQLKSELDKLSYTLGAQLGMNMKQQGVILNSAAFVAGLNDGMAGNKLQLSSFDMQQTVSVFQKQLIAQREQQFKQQATANQAQGDAFLANNAKQTGVTVLPSGLQYKVVTPGSGPSPKDSDIVTVNYVGTFINGTVFDSSYQRGQPATFPVSGVIPGWQQALKLMQPGSTWQIFVPAKLAYGEQGMGDAIGPNETLIFKIQLLSIKNA